MSLTNHLDFLRTVFKIDAAICVASGLLMTAGAGIVSGLTEIPPGLLIAAGASLFPIALFMILVAARQLIWTPGVWLIIFGNIAWVWGSLWLLVGGAIKPNAIGVAFVLVQAASVAALAALEYMGILRAPNQLTSIMSERTVSRKP